MITGLDISTRVYELLMNSPVKDAITGIIDYVRDDYSKEEIVILPRSITGEGSVRFGQINVNIHIPDTKIKGKTKPNLERHTYLTNLVIEALKNHYEIGKGYNWTIGLIDPPYKENDIDEHFTSVKLEITVRNN